MLMTLLAGGGDGIVALFHRREVDLALAAVLRDEAEQVVGALRCRIGRGSVRDMQQPRGLAVDGGVLPYRNVGVPFVSLPMKFPRVSPPMRLFSSPAGTSTDLPHTWAHTVAGSFADLRKSAVILK